jgi:hypothetical protein
LGLFISPNTEPASTYLRDKVLQKVSTLMKKKG